MKVFITSINGRSGTSQYVQAMVSDIAHQIGFRNMGIYYYNSREESSQSLSSRYDGIIASISRGDIIFFQHPTGHPLKFEVGLINRIKAYGGRVIIVVHDIEPLMFATNQFMLGTVIEFLNSAESLVVPSYTMRNFLQNNGIRGDMKFVVQEIQDCLTDIQLSQEPRYQKMIQFVGNPSKCPFLQEWNFDVPLKVYTSEQYSGKNVQIIERMNFNEVVLQLAKGGFGLVWYGDDYSCRYIKYSVPVKLSVYLAAGIPVIVPRRSSNQYLIEKNHLGLVVDSLGEAVEQIMEMKESDYREYVQHVIEFSSLIRNGYFTKKFLIDSVLLLFRHDVTDYSISNLIYENTEYFSASNDKIVNVMDMQETLEYIKCRQVSVARFGDGETALMTGHSIPYQDYNEELAKRLKQIITMPDNDKLLVCIPDVFEKRERYNIACNSFWESHLERYKEFYDEIIISEKCYGSAFLSRPYMDLSDKTISEKHFYSIKEFFADKDLLIVEGFYSRSGVGNDLFQRAKSVERIICPSRNAYSKYGIILDTVKQYGTNKLILLMLGPTAKVLAADLAFDGYWAVDIGHIDSEYEWYKTGATSKMKLPNKHTAEFGFDENIVLQNDDIYTNEIVAILSD